MKRGLFALVVFLFVATSAFSQYWKPATPTYTGPTEFCSNEIMFLDTIPHPDSLKSTPPFENRFWYVYDTARCPMRIASDLNTAGTEQQQLRFSSDVSYGVAFDVYIRAVRMWKPDSVNFHTVYSDSCLKLTLRVDTLPSPELPEDKSISEGDSVNLTIPNYHRILWSTGDTVPSIVAKDAGVYWVEAFSEIGCRGSDTFKLTIEKPTTTESAKEETKPFAIFPNPNSGIFTIELSKPSTLMIIDASGGVIEEVFSSERKVSIEVSHLTEGMYVLLNKSTGQFSRFVIEH